MRRQRPRPSYSTIIPVPLVMVNPILSSQKRKGGGKYSIYTFDTSIGMATNSEVNRAKEKAVGGRKVRCRKGKSCSATCISRWKTCLVEMSSELSPSLQKAKNLIGGRSHKVLPGLRGKGQFIRESQKTTSNVRLQSGNRGTSSKLKVPTVDASTSQAQGIRLKYDNFKKALVQELERLSREGKKGSYDKIEERLMRLQGKLGGKLGDKEIVAKGKIWSDYGKDRVDVRRSKFSRALDKLSIDMENAANNKDYARFVEIYGKYSSLYNSKAAKKLGVGIDDVESSVRNLYLQRLEKDPSFKNYRDELRAQVLNAAAKGDRKEYLNLERKLMPISPEGSVKKGAIWREAGVNMTLNKLLDSMEKAAIDGDKDKYDKIERKFFKIRFGLNSFSSIDERVMETNIEGKVWKNRDSLALQKKHDLVSKKEVDDAIKAGKGFMDRYRERLNSVSSILRRQVELEKELKGRLYDGGDKLKPEERLKLQSMLDRVVSRGENATSKSTKLMEEIRSELLKTKLSEEDIKGILGRLNLSGDGALVDQVRGQVEEFSRMFNGRGLLESSGNGTFLKEMEVNPRRAHADRFRGFISTDGTARTTFHEIAHFMEFSSTGIKNYAEMWRDLKAFSIGQVENAKGMENVVRMPDGGITRHRMETLSDRYLPMFSLAAMPINSNMRYNYSEEVVVDRFMDLYMGKVYQGRDATEVISMGAENFSNPKSMSKLYMNHPDLFETIVGLALT